MTTFIQPPFWAYDRRWQLGRTVPTHVGVTFDPSAVITEPLTVDAAKLYLRVSQPDEDAVIADLITAARVFCEKRTGRPIARQDCDVIYDRIAMGQWITLPYAPVSAVVQIEATDIVGVATVLDPSAYLVDLASEPARVGLPTAGFWPMSLRAFQAIAIRLTVGYVVPPADLVQAMRLLLGNFYENREAVQSGHIIATLPLGVEDILAPYELVSVA
jgi:uncharacterized phiE125 gp8 family phage protein